jgi:hypothetical protein
MKDALIDLYSLYTDKVEYIDKTLLMWVYKEG